MKSSEIIFVVDLVRKLSSFILFRNNFIFFIQCDQYINFAFCIRHYSDINFFINLCVKNTNFLSKRIAIYLAICP